MDNRESDLALMGERDEGTFDEGELRKVRAGISGIRIHDLRHAFASQVDETQKKAMADALGHATLTVTDSYRHSTPEAVRKQASPRPLTSALPQAST